MTPEQIVAVVYLAVSIESLAAQGLALRRLRRRPTALPGLIRTAASRVGCSVLYVVVGVNALIASWFVLQLTLAVYVLTQLTWQINSRLDVRLGHPRPRRRRFITITINRAPAQEGDSR